MSKQPQAGEYWITRDGDKAYVGYVREGQDYCLIGHIEGSYLTFVWLSTGCTNQNESENASDLIEEWVEPLGGTVWVNVYLDGESKSHPLKSYADAASDKSRLACIEVNWKEGEGL